MTKTNILWVIVANSSFAQVYEVKGHGHEIKEIHLFDNPDGRKKNSEFDSDRPGRSFDSLGSARHAYSKENDPHSHELDGFAHEISSYIVKALDAHKFHELALVAPSHFIGTLHNVIPEHAKKMITKEINKDLPLNITGKERIDQLCKYLDLWNRADANTSRI